MIHSLTHLTHPTLWRGGRYGQAGPGVTRNQPPYAVRVRVPGSTDRPDPLLDTKRRWNAQERSLVCDFFAPFLV